MPKRTDIEKILIIGSGPIVIGQACEFDYSGTQACKALRREGYQVVLVNSNPATIMTDPETADRTYIEPLTVNMLKQIIRAERPDALLPTVGGQTALNLAVELAESGVLNQFGVELIGARLQAMLLAEDRMRFKQAMLDTGLDVPRSDVITSVEEARDVAGRLGYPLIVRPSFTLGGGGGGVVYTPDELAPAVEQGLLESPVSQVLLEESVLGWKEFELEVMRDHADNFVVVCSIENFDPMGVHTGDSITIAPAQTLTDKEYQTPARPGSPRHLRCRRGDWWLEHPVRRTPGDGPRGNHRNEPARQPQFRAGLESDRLPHRQDRCPTGCRLHPGRNSQRHHPRDARFVRAGD